MRRYAIWDKKSDVITPAGTIYTAEEWKKQHPVAALDHITVICGAGEINGSDFGTLGQMVQIYEQQGADFSEAKTDEDKLAVIEAFLDAREEASKHYVSVEERTAAALEFLALNAMPDAEEIE